MRPIPSGDHGYQSEISLALSGDGGLLASGVLNPSGESNSLNIHQLIASDTATNNLQWLMINSFEQPLNGAINFASSLTFATDAGGERLFVGADSAGIVFVY